MEKRKLSHYEYMMLASAYNLRNYCQNTTCCDCIFYQEVANDIKLCVLTTPDNPWNWELKRCRKEVTPDA